MYFVCLFRDAVCCELHLFEPEPELASDVHDAIARENKLCASPPQAVGMQRQWEARIYTLRSAQRMVSQQFTGEPIANKLPKK